MQEKESQELNQVKERLLILSPTVKMGLEHEGDKGDFYRCGDYCIGKGGFGEVWKVNHKKSNDLYVIKVLDKERLKKQNLIEQLNLEIQIMYKVHHPHIMQLINHFEDDNNFFMVMPYASRGQLFTLLKKNTKLDQKMTAQFLRETISAVKYLHEHDIIHRDIKPENILLDQNYRVKLSDFGWSNFCKKNEKRKTFCGTPEYLSPEMVNKSPHDYRVDIWSLGVLLFECLAGYPPFTGQTEAELLRNIKQLKIHWPIDFPPLAKNLVTKILKANPEERPSLDEILKHSWFNHNPMMRPLLVNKLTDERKILESHLINSRPTDPEIKEKLDNLFPDLKGENKIEEENKDNENMDKEAKRKENIIKMKEIYNNINQNLYFNDAIKNNDKDKGDNKDGNKNDENKDIKELKAEHEKEKEKLNRVIINLNKKIKELENENNSYKNENNKLKEEISKFNDIQEKEKIIETEKKELFNEIEKKNNNILEMKTKYNEINIEKERYEKELTSKENKNLYFYIKLKNKEIEDTYKEDYVEGKTLFSILQKNIEAKINELTNTSSSVELLSTFDNYTTSVKERILKEDNLLELPFYTLKKEILINNWNSTDITSEIVEEIKKYEEKGITPKSYTFIITNKSNISEAIEIQNIKNNFPNNNEKELIIHDILEDENTKRLKENKITYKYLNEED